MSKHTYASINAAIEVLRETCQDNNYCSTCPLYNHHYGCKMMSEEPSEWTDLDETKEEHFYD